MNTVKDILNFCNAAIFYDYKNLGVIEELDQLRKCIINNFQETIHITRILVALSIIDDVILKINNTDFENVIENIDDLRENLLFMVSSKKMIGEDKDNATTQDA